LKRDISGVSLKRIPQVTYKITQYIVERRYSLMRKGRYEEHM